MGISPAFEQQLRCISSMERLTDDGLLLEARRAAATRA